MVEKIRVSATFRPRCWGSNRFPPNTNAPEYPNASMFVYCIIYIYICTFILTTPNPQP